MIREAVQPAVSRDGVQLEIGSNCANVLEVQTAIAHGAEGIGVFRTEIAFAGYDVAPDEDHQLTLYREIVEGAKGRPVIFRTFDVGGDNLSGGCRFRKKRTLSWDTGLSGCTMNFPH